MWALRVNYLCATEYDFNTQRWSIYKHSLGKTGILFQPLCSVKCGFKTDVTGCIWMLFLWKLHAPLWQFMGNVRICGLMNLYFLIFTANAVMKAARVVSYNVGWFCTLCFYRSRSQLIILDLQICRTLDVAAAVHSHSVTCRLVHHLPLVFHLVPSQH